MKVARNMWGLNIFLGKAYADSLMQNCDHTTKKGLQIDKLTN